MVLTAVDDVEKSREICALCRKRKIPVNVADIPPSCDFYFGSQIRSGPLQIMISTNGQSPKLANLIRRRIENSLPEGVGEAIEKVGTLRCKLRERAPGVGGRAWEAEDAMDGGRVHVLGNGRSGDAGRRDDGKASG